MPIRYRCPSCQQLLAITSKMAERASACPKCGHISIVPSADDVQQVEFDVIESSSRLPEADRGEANPHESTVERGEIPTSAKGDKGEGEAFEPDAGGFQVRSRKLDADEMDLTPMVDMTFLLLIFFMITASFSVQKSIAFPPPSPDQKGAAQATHSLEEFENNSVIVRIDGRNVIYIDDEPQNDPARIVDVFRATISTRRNELIVMADDSALHETVVAVIDAANAAGMQKIRLAAQAVE